MSDASTVRPLPLHALPDDRPEVRVEFDVVRVLLVAPAGLDDIDVVVLLSECDTDQEREIEEEEESFSRARHDGDRSVGRASELPKADWSWLLRR